MASVAETSRRIAAVRTDTWAPFETAYLESGEW
jgi:hypothetical protein